MKFNKISKLTREAGIQEFLHVTDGETYGQDLLHGHTKPLAVRRLESALDLCAGGTLRLLLRSPGPIPVLPE